MLTKIYDFDRLEDEVASLTVQSEQDREKRGNKGLRDVLKSREIRLAFLAGGGLQVRKSKLGDTVYAKHNFSHTGRTFVNAPCC